MAKSKKEPVEGVDFVWVKNPNSNTRGRKFLSASEKAAMRTPPPARPTKAAAPAKPAAAKPKVNKAPPARPVSQTPSRNTEDKKGNTGRIKTNNSPASVAGRQEAKVESYRSAMGKYTKAEASAMSPEARATAGLPPDNLMWRTAYGWKPEPRISPADAATGPKYRNPGNRTALERMKAEQGYAKGGMVKKGKKC